MKNAGAADSELTKEEVTELFQATAISMGMQPNVIEKDFWVCFILDHFTLQTKL